MTIAIGMLCEGGALLCADTKGVMSDGSVVEVCKITTKTANWGALAIADSTDDANASNTLIQKITDSLEVSKISKWADLEDSVSFKMEQWSGPFKEMPQLSLLLVSTIDSLQETRMYLCQPPNTIVQKREYVAVGSGSGVTDAEAALFKTSPLSVLQHPQKNLRQISYLMYRAKKNHVFCGLHTQGVYLRCNEGSEWITPLDFEAAERQAGKLDFLLQATTTFALFSDPGANLAANAKGVGEMVIGLEGLRSVSFHNLQGDLIGGSTVARAL